MTRTQYTAELRKAGFTVRPGWQGSTEHGPGRDLTCYEVSTATGDIVANIIVQDLGHGDGVNVWFENIGRAVADDIAALRAMVRAGA